MWYFSWIPGVGVALTFGVSNALWLEANGAFSRVSRTRSTRSTRHTGRARS